ncbi:hypothetical protein X772_35815 [Mesorhizobium sp. LSJC280B00]|nr:hypothetical protein X772_35815 [Mesorhizobium sp. LSJC280B00]
MRFGGMTISPGLGDPIGAKPLRQIAPAAAGARYPQRCVEELVVLCP